MDNPNRIVLTISFVPGEPLQVSGPVQDRMLCYSMLEMAKDAVRDFKPDRNLIVMPVPRFNFDANGN